MYMQDLYCTQKSQNKSRLQKCINTFCAHIAAVHFFTCLSVKNAFVSSILMDGSYHLGAPRPNSYAWFLHGHLTVHVLFFWQIKTLDIYSRIVLLQCCVCLSLKPPVCFVPNVNSSRGVQTAGCPTVSFCCCCQSHTGLRRMAHMSHAGEGGEDYFHTVGGTVGQLVPVV